MAWQLNQLKGIKLFLATGVPGNAQRAGGGQGLKKPLRFSCRFHERIVYIFDGSSLCMDLPPISTYWLLAPPKSLSENRFKRLFVIFGQ